MAWMLQEIASWTDDINRMTYGKEQVLLTCIPTGSGKSQLWSEHPKPTIPLPGIWEELMTHQPGLPGLATQCPQTPLKA
jgi:hypothetical protein